MFEHEIKFLWFLWQKYLMYLFFVWNHFCAFSKPNKKDFDRLKAVHLWINYSCRVLSVICVKTYGNLICNRRKKKKTSKYRVQCLTSEQILLSWKILIYFSMFRWFFFARNRAYSFQLIVQSNLNGNANRSEVIAYR